MKRLLIPAIPTPSHPVTLPPNELRHATKVLRLGDGDVVEVLDGNGHCVHATLRQRGKTIILEYLEAATNRAAAAAAAAQILPIILEQAILKSDSMSWVIEKAVELGVKALVPVITARTVVRVDEKNAKSLVARWERIADQSLKQCGRLHRLAIHPPTLLSELQPRQNRLWCDESRDQAGDLARSIWPSQIGQAENIHLLIGPEGGWDQKERERLLNHPDFRDGKLRQISLGPLILRAETAAIYSISVLNAALRGGV